MLNPDRIADLRSQMAAAGLDCVALWPSANWRYLCSFAPIAAIAATSLCLQPAAWGNGPVISFDAMASGSKRG